MKKRIVDILYKYGDNLYIEEEIPSKKLLNAEKYYPIDNIDSEEVLALLDTTVFGSAKTGMVFTSHGIYFKSDWATESIKHFLSWEDLCENEVTKGSMFCILLARKCEFNVSGSDIKRDVLIDLLNEIRALFKEPSRDIETHTESHYRETLLNIIALSIVADGEIEDSEIEMAYTILENDIFMKKENVKIEELGDKIEEFFALKEKSESLFKLKVLSLASEVNTLISLDEKENILLTLEAMLESVNDGDREYTELLMSKIKESFSH